MVRQPDMAVMSGDQYYIDVDAPSLRIIYNILQGLMQVTDLQTLSGIEIALVHSTAEYLLCSEIVNASRELIDSTRRELDLEKERNLDAVRPLLVLIAKIEIFQKNVFETLEKKIRKDKLQFEKFDEQLQFLTDKLG